MLTSSGTDHARKSSMSETDDGGEMGRKRDKRDLSKMSLDGAFAEDTKMSDDDMEEAGGLDD
jgi:hypothetical protein